MFIINNYNFSLFYNIIICYSTFMINTQLFKSLESLRNRKTFIFLFSKEGLNGSKVKCYYFELSIHHNYHYLHTHTNKYIMQHNCFQH